MKALRVLAILTTVLVGSLAVMREVGATGSWFGSQPATAGLGTTSGSTQQAAGDGRYQSAVEMAALVGGGSLSGLDRLIVVAGESFPDALLASGLAGFLDDGGRSGRTAILLTEAGVLPPVVEEAIRASGVPASQVLVVGGAEAVSDEVRSAVARAGGWNGTSANPVTRIAGEDRYSTAAAIADYVFTTAGAALEESYRTVLVASGEEFSDALAAGSLAYRNGHLLLLSPPAGAAPATLDTVEGLQATCAVLVGGTTALAPQVATQIEAELVGAGSGCGVERIGGRDRFETAAQVADRFVEVNGAPGEVLVASGLDFADALTTGPLAGGNRPLLLTVPNRLSAPASAWLQEHSASIGDIRIIGGTNTIAPAVRSQVNAIAAAAGAAASSRATVPSAPTITGVSAGNTTLSVTFTAGADGGSAITNYEYSTNNGATWTTRSPVGTGSPLEITGLTNGTTSLVRIRALNVVGESAESNMLSGTPVSVPSAPMITGVTVGNATLSVTFTAGADGGRAITNYEYSTNNGATWTTRNPASTGSPLEITGLANGTTYLVRIRALNVLGEGAESTMVTATPFTVPDAPGGPTISAITATSMTVSWTAPTSDGGAAISSYVVRRNGSPVETLGAGILSFNATGLTAGTTYAWQVLACNGANSCMASASVNATTWSTPAAPTITSVTAGNATLSVTFTAGADGGTALTNYQYSTDGGSTWRTRATGTTASPLVITTISGVANTQLTNGTTYQVQIRAVNSVGEGAGSNTVSGTPVESCAQGGVCVVGDTGPAGGIVFYVAPPNTTFLCGVNLNLTCRYLEAWTADVAFDGMTNAKWSTQIISTGASSQAIGAGYNNTQLALNNDGGSHPTVAISLVRNTRGGLSDWYLPSLGELSQLRQQRATVGGFQDQYYWSSTESDSHTAWGLNFTDGQVLSTVQKTVNYLHVRPIRAF